MRLDTSWTAFMLDMMTTGGYVVNGSNSSAGADGIRGVLVSCDVPSANLAGAAERDEGFD